MKSNKDYDIAISFAGEDQDIARELAQALEHGTTWLFWQNANGVYSRQLYLFSR